MSEQIEQLDDEAAHWGAYRFLARKEGNEYLERLAEERQYEVWFARMRLRIREENRQEENNEPPTMRKRHFVNLPEVKEREFDLALAKTRLE